MAWSAQRKRVLDRDHWTCVYCGVPLDGEHNSPTSATVDHVQAIVLDPDRTYSDDELVACCRAENGRKQDKSLLRTNFYSPAWL